MSTTLIDLAKQCCDADEYLDMGYACAQMGNCYNPLRPIGDTLWFGIPYAFNTSENIFFYLQVVLLAMVGISVFYLLKKILSVCIFLLALLFLTWPTFFHTLSDTPATLFFIEGIVLALIGLNRHRAIIFFAAGISLGLSALLRTAYFYPLVIAGFLFFIFWLWQKNRQWPIIFILSFIVPLLFQFFSTWKHTGQWHFLSEGRNRTLMQLHLDSAAAGYDTYLPQTGTLWSPDCASSAGLLPSLKAADISSAFCILKNRFSFYLGSYAPSTYLGEGGRNFFDNHYAQITRSDYFIQSKSIMPLPPGKYRYSILLWAEKSTPSSIALQFDNVTFSKTTDSFSQLINPLLSKSISITGTSQRYTADITNDTSGYIIARINSATRFNAQDELLEPTATASDLFQSSKQQNNTMSQSAGSTNNHRIFSSVYLVINSLVALFAVFYSLMLLVKTRSPIAVFIGALLFSVLIQCLMIIPEQRFIQGFLCACWLMSLLLLTNHHKQT